MRVAEYLDWDVSELRPVRLFVLFLIAPPPHGPVSTLPHLPWVPGPSVWCPRRRWRESGATPRKRPFFLSNQILQEMMKDMDQDGSGSVSLAEWVRAGATTVPLLVLLGMDMVSGKGW